MNRSLNSRGAACLLLFAALCFGIRAFAQDSWWSVQTSGLDTSLRGVSAAYAHDAKGKPFPVVWASGSKGVILRSVDGGKTWKRLHVDGGDSLDFRGIVAFDEKTVYVISIGNGENSRIYKTEDGGANWNLQYRDGRKDFFLDAIACDSPTRCFALSDPMDGKFLLLATTDGEHWNQRPRENMPAALPKEGAFAASNSSLAVDGENIYFGTGGPAARVFQSKNGGRTWSVTQTPIASGNASSGIFSLALSAPDTILAVGGDYEQPAASYHTAAVSSDGGKTWQLAPQMPGGFRSAVAMVDGSTAVAVGTNGTDISFDRGEHWQPTDSLNLNAVAILDVQNGWAVGPKGTIGRLVNHKQYLVRGRVPRARNRASDDGR
ncbi:MAG TPA: YCF48-related protein [Candidatus Limnocylindrales bacterium]|nr:YCF48-related protein [Candidatus Limnocylindrales bacterium]